MASKAAEETESGIPLLDVEAQNENRDEDVENKNVVTTAAPPSNAGAGRKFLIWTAINMLATIGIVFTNKAIFNDPAFTLMQTSFACFHFCCTGLTLYVVSRPAFGAFVPKKAGIVEMLPLALSMCLNVVLPNFSLAFASVPVYQLSRVLLTPMTAITNYVLYRATIPLKAVLALVPVCVGVFITSYYDTFPSSKETEKETTITGLIFAFSGVCASALYTVLIASYHKKLQMNSSQLLFNQAPISSVMLLFAVPIVDKIPDLPAVPAYRWGMIIMSGGFAALINISQFFIIAGSGPVSSTVVGHLKTVSIVAIGWTVTKRAVADRAAGGVLLTIFGIVLYSYIMLTKR